MQALSSSLNDTHPEVTQAAQKALERVGGAVANPEIAQQVPTLIKALQDPEKYTNEVKISFIFLISIILAGSRNIIVHSFHTFYRCCFVSPFGANFVPWSERAFHSNQEEECTDHR